MTACTKLQSVGDKGKSTATETGLALAKQHLDNTGGGLGRQGANKVVVLLTDGVPNDFTSPSGTVDSYMSSNPTGDFYQTGAYWLDAPLMQTAMMAAKKWEVYPVGVGLGCDYDFMDRMARIGTTAKGGLSPRGSGNPADYEQRMIDIFEEIIESPKVRLVQ